MNVTLQTIADRVGVTRATVSMALRNAPQISASRREEIRKVAEELGYRPNALVSSLMSHLRQSKPLPQQTGILYLISGNNPSPGGPGTAYDLYVRGAAARAAERGFNLETLWIREPGMTDARIGKILWARNIPGVIVGPREDYLPLPQLPWERLAAVMIGFSFPEPQLDRVVANFYNSIRLAMAYIKRDPHPPIRLILPKDQDRNVLHIWKACYLQERERQKHFKDPLVVDSPKLAIEWVRQNPRCTVLGTNLILQWLREARLREFKDFRFISLNVENQTELTGVWEPSLATGAEAADLTISRIHLNRKGLPDSPHITLIDPTWQHGRSEE